MTAALDFKPIMDEVFYADAAELIETGCIFAGDDEIFDRTPAAHIRQITACLEWKYDDCAPRFVKDCVNFGIRCPVIFYRLFTGSWSLDNGHHRFAVAWKHAIPVPVIFIDNDANWSKVAANYDFYERVQSDGGMY